MENNILLKVSDLSIEFVGSTINQVVNKLDFELAKGKTLAIVGESGSGKSVSTLSLLQLLNSRRSNVTGDALFNYNNKQLNLIELSTAQIENLRGNKISMIFQEPMSALNPVMKCGHQVAEVIKRHSNLDSEKAKIKTLQLFKQVELPRPSEMFDSYPHELSGGQQQRVMIAMALANNPVLLIADEPTTALDPAVQGSIMSLIKRIQTERQMAMIFISHDLDVVAEVADQIIVMQNGSVVEMGTAEEILRSPQHPYTKGLLKSKPGKHYRGMRLPTVADFLNNLSFTPIPRAPKINDGSEILELKKVSVHYHQGGFLQKPTVVKAINNVNFKLYKGESLGLIGPSGCGKTTTGRVLAGWVKPTEGEVLFKGLVVLNPKLNPGKAWSRKVQLIFQDPYGALNPTIKVGEAISEPIIYHNLANGRKEARIQTENLLEKVGLLKEHYDRYPHEFSGGQRQRIVIARALACKPEVIVCDESVAALDVSVQSQVLNLLNDLQEEFNLSYIFISHDHNVIEYFCDRIIEMKAGEVFNIRNNSTTADALNPTATEGDDDLITQGIDLKTPTVKVEEKPPIEQISDFENFAAENLKQSHPIENADIIENQNKKGDTGNEPQLFPGANTLSQGNEVEVTSSMDDNLKDPTADLGEKSVVATQESGDLRSDVLLEEIISGNDEGHGIADISEDQEGASFPIEEEFDNSLEREEENIEEEQRKSPKTSGKGKTYKSLGDFLKANQKE